MVVLIDLYVCRVLCGVWGPSPATSDRSAQLTGCPYRTGLQSRVLQGKRQLQLLLHCSQFPVSSMQIHIIFFLLDIDSEGKVSL
jgi:hypothetical protein